jgi:hypothetical protein
MASAIAGDELNGFALGNRLRKASRGSSVLVSSSPEDFRGDLAQHPFPLLPAENLLGGFLRSERLVLVCKSPKPHAVVRAFLGHGHTTPIKGEAFP